MRIRTRRLWVLLFLAVSTVSVIVLAGSLPRLELRPGEPFTLEEPKPGTAAQDADLGEPVAAPDFWAKLLLVMWIGMLACVPIGIVLLVVSPEARRQALRYVGPILILLVILLLPRTNTEELAVLETPAAATMSAPVSEATPSVFTPDPPRWLAHSTNILLGIVAALALVGLLSLVLRRRGRRLSPLEQLAWEAQKAITAIQGGADLRDTIMRCYFEMSRVLRQERGISREAAMTPREFESQLADLGLPEAPVRELTRLFEAVRYGTKIPDTADERRALSSLSAVVEVCCTSP